MPLEELLGQSATLTILRFAPHGAFLSVSTERDAGTLLLLGPEIPEGARTGDTIDVFVHLDSEGRPIATTRVPKVKLGEVAFLEVTAVTDFGAFVDWGLAKELLVPFAEQTMPLEVGARHPIGLYIDGTGRLAGTMRVTEMLRRKPAFALDQWVMGEAWRNDPDIGLFVIVERAFVGVVPASEPHSLTRGQAARFRVSNLLPDGKMELSLRGYAHEEMEGDAQKILDVLSRPNAPRVGDRSSPDEIRRVFGLSKKAFKRAAGRLLKERAIDIDSSGFLVSRRASAGRAPKK
jgi:predicted RNA-binding protein (virulence factor B family)